MSSAALTPLAKWTSPSSQAPMPDTLMATRFLEAIIKWAKRRSRGERMIIPAGAVDAVELKRVVCALACARRPE
jgi:hypothetical protein